LVLHWISIDTFAGISLYIYHWQVHCIGICINTLLLYLFVFIFIHYISHTHIGHYIALQCIGQYITAVINIITSTDNILSIALFDSHYYTVSYIALIDRQYHCIYIYGGIILYHIIRITIVIINRHHHLYHQ